jgi:hypothetical protein
MRSIKKDKDSFASSLASSSIHMPKIIRRSNWLRARKPGDPHSDSKSSIPWDALWLRECLFSPSKRFRKSKKYVLEFIAEHPQHGPVCVLP